MSLYVNYLIICICSGVCLGQFSNIFSSVMNSASGGTSKTGSNCTAITSCYPWCARQMDSNGCMKCQCSNSGSSMASGPMSGMNPMNGMNPMAQAGLNPMSQHGPNPMSLSGLNPMAHMFSGASGGMSPMSGGRVQPQIPGCEPVPTTCPVPQPWCERIIGKDGCLKCICGKDLLTYLSSLKVQTKMPSTTRPSPALALTSRTTMVTTTYGPSRDTTTTYPCITSFYCTKLCDNGYKTDTLGCPVCECVQNVLIDTPVDATNPPGKHAHSLPSTHAPISSSTIGNVISCHGIFDCALVCSNGYKTSPNGCPLCECMS